MPRATVSVGGACIGPLIAAPTAFIGELRRLWARPYIQNRREALLNFFISSLFIYKAYTLPLLPPVELREPPELPPEPELSFGRAVRVTLR